MPALIRSRRIRVFIGADQQDWSTSAGEFLPQWDSLSESGLITVSATLEILKVSTNPESIDPRDNPTRWRPGQPVRVEVANSAGAYVTHPMGRLFLLEEPEFPAPGEGIVLELGCRLAWHNTFEYDDEKTGVTLAAELNSGSVVINLLKANEILQADMAITTNWPYGVVNPDGKGPGGSFIQQAGEIAYSNDYRFLYQNTAGTVVAGQLSLAIASPTATITLGTNDVAYQAVKTEGSPPDQIKVAGSGVVKTRLRYPIVDVVTVEGDKSLYKYSNFFGIQTCAGEGTIGRTTTKVDRTKNGALTNEVTIVREEGITAGVSKDPAVGASGLDICGLRKWKITTTTKTFNGAKFGRLEQEIQEIDQERFTYFVRQDGSSQIGFVDLVGRTTTTYTYTQGETVERIERVEEQIRYLVDGTLQNQPPFETPNTQLVEVKREIDTWEKVGKDTWKKSRTEKYPRKYKDNNPEGGSGAPITSSTTTVSNSGQTQPPRAELLDDEYSLEDVEYQATINYTQPGGGSGRTRKRLYTLPYGFSQAQCETMAQLHLKLIAGRHRAAIVELPVTDALLTAPPLFPFNVVEPSGRVLHYRADSVTWEHTVDTCKVAVSGILVGTTPAPTDEHPNPDPEPITGTIVVAGGVPVEASGVQVFATV
jgi:hypothetical protein